MDRGEDAARYHVFDGSALCGDDRRSAPYHVSHEAWQRLDSAVDHLFALKVLIADAGVLPTYAPFTLLRAAIENAASAVWLLDPSSRSERVLRRLRLEAANAKNSDRAVSLLGSTPNRSLDERKAQ